MKTRGFVLGALFASAFAGGAAFATVPSIPSPLEAHRAARADQAITEMSLDDARSILGDDATDDLPVMFERARLELYAGNYDLAAKMLEKPELASRDEGAELGDVARGAQRGMAATVRVVDDGRGISIGLQDDDDAALVPVLADVANKVRAQLEKDLGVALPKPLRIDLVRDQFTLAAMTGLPLQSAQTTGTVAIAKWGRVTMISPRATTNGFPWMDTLAHEMTHLALTRGTRDKAPLWLQEGVAKREETRWRDPEPLDDFPGVDQLAAIGLERGLGRSLDKLGPSIAMLPSAEEAQVAFAEVSSFIRFFVKELGDDALPKLVLRLKYLAPPDTVDKAIADVSGESLSGWDKRWRAHLASVPRDMPADMLPGATLAHGLDIAKHARVGELLHARGRDKAAVVELAKAQKLAPFDASLRVSFADALLGLQQEKDAAALVDKIEDVHEKEGRWLSLHARFFDDPPKPRAFEMALEQDAYDPFVACEEMKPPEKPADPIRAAICDAARRMPR